jgi:hypothetical protein
MDTTVVSLRSDAVPGGAVRSETTSAMGTVKVHSVTETVGFEVK